MLSAFKCRVLRCSAVSTGGVAKLCQKHYMQLAAAISVDGGALKAALADEAYLQAFFQAGSKRRKAKKAKKGGRAPEAVG